ncbi:MAG TPA: 3' terminal RNA ribose 2'-O-methyltransferase Hen1 [Planctomycetota bacterium]|nr:3' terminal RNA ribose 2'-O-methyltransferase Hen1 [Planctomycetota bacterium]
MLLIITTTRRPATNLGWLLHKHPGKCQSFELPFGKAHVCYPEATEERCTAALILDIDPVGLVRIQGGPSGQNWSLEQYVNDRPYVASSFLSVAISRVFGTAISGICKGKQEVADAALPLQVKLAAVPCRGGEAFLRALFEPLGYTVAAHRHTLDEKFPEWGESSYYTVELAGTVRLSDLLSHLYVLIPVLDDDKHYWVGEAEVEKLLRHGEGWLADHPAKEQIARRYLMHRHNLTREALARLADEDAPDPEAEVRSRAREEEEVEKTLNLNEQRLGAVLAALRASGARRVLDLGCGEGKLLQSLVKDKSITEVVGLDASVRALEIAQRRLKLDRLAPAVRERLKLLHGALTYRDKRLAGFDAAAVVEVIEHLDPPRLAAFERMLFEFAKPATVVLTTPNIEYNAKFENMPAGKLRHKDHRFEWTRAEFRAWAEGVAGRFGYSVRFLPVGTEDPTLGAPTQMAVFSRS